MQGPRPITDLEQIFGMRFLVRASLDVPIQDGVVQNDFRIQKALPTFKYLIEHGARVIILTHVGRDKENSTKPIYDVLKQYIPTTYVPHVIGEEAMEVIANLKEGTACILENIRRYDEEENNDAVFAQTLASYADFYVNDAFAVSHRAHASIVGIPRHLPSFAGITFMEEYAELTKALQPEHPSLFILGGAKYETKAPLIDSLSAMYTHTFIGGALGNDFLLARGFGVGESRISNVGIDPTVARKDNIYIPIDVVVQEGTTTMTVPCDSVPPHAKIKDVGLHSVDILAPYIAHAKTILWNGPLGYYEEGFDAGTKKCAELIAKSDAFSIIGGGDTVAAIESLGLSNDFGFLSTSGGAMLEFLEKGTLPGIQALEK